jgi:hypothetical protein
MRSWRSWKRAARVGRRRRNRSSIPAGSPIVPDGVLSSYRGNEHRLPAARGALAQLFLEPADPLLGGGDDPAVVIEDDSGRGITDRELAEPGSIAGRPGLGPRRRPQTLPQQEFGEPMLGAEEVGLGIEAGPNQVPQSLVLGPGTQTGVRSPLRSSRASVSASRLSVLTRSPDFLGISEGPPPGSQCRAR